MHAKSNRRASVTIAFAFALAIVTAVRANAQVNNYVVGPQDVLTIQVFDQADLGGKYSVETDGSISFPLIGRIKVSDHTLREVEELLKKELANGFFRHPQVSVAVEQYRSQRVFVHGEVRNPGTYPLTGDMSLIEVLARAGSVTESASGEALIVRLRAGHKVDGPIDPNSVDNDADVIHVDIKDLQAGKLSQNVVLHDNDTIFVPRAELVYVSGQVRNPGSFALRKGMTVLQLIALAGGLTDRGAEGRITARRTNNGATVEVRVKTDDLVQPGDTIIVPERYF